MLTVMVMTTLKIAMIQRKHLSRRVRHPGDGIDQDCDGQDAGTIDSDGDGYDTTMDCDDSITISIQVLMTFPVMVLTKACGQDAGSSNPDVDGDGYDSPQTAMITTKKSGAYDIPGDGIDKTVMDRMHNPQGAIVPRC